MIRSLWNCFEARYPDGIKHRDYLYCREGHQLGQGHVHKRDADKQKPLEFRACQLCRDFNPFESEYIREE